MLFLSLSITLSFSYSFFLSLTLSFSNSLFFLLFLSFSNYTFLFLLPLLYLLLFLLLSLSLTYTLSLYLFLTLYISLFLSFSLSLCPLRFWKMITQKNYFKCRKRWTWCQRFGAATIPQLTKVLVTTHLWSSWSVTSRANVLSNSKIIVPTLLRSDWMSQVKWLALINHNT